MFLGDGVVSLDAEASLPNHHNLNEVSGNEAPNGID